MARRRVKLTKDETCQKCGEVLPAGMTAYAITGTTFENYEHYGKCKGVQRAEDKAAALKSLGLDADTVTSINRLVEYLYRDERKDFEMRVPDETDGHIFLDVERVKKFMESLP